LKKWILSLGMILILLGFVSLQSMNRQFHIKTIEPKSSQTVSGDNTLALDMLLPCPMYMGEEANPNPSQNYPMNDTISGTSVYLQWIIGYLIGGFDFTATIQNVSDYVLYFNLTLPDDSIAFTSTDMSVHMLNILLNNYTFTIPSNLQVNGTILQFAFNLVYTSSFGNLLTEYNSGMIYNLTWISESMANPVIQSLSGDETSVIVIIVLAIPVVIIIIISLNKKKKIDQICSPLTEDGITNLEQNPLCSSRADELAKMGITSQTLRENMNKLIPQSNQFSKTKDIERI